jgi:hypothetical protein
MSLFGLLTRAKETTFQKADRAASTEKKADARRRPLE